MALGHPLGATGTRLVLTVLKELRRRGGGVGVASACIGGGQGIALVVETVGPTSPAGTSWSPGEPRHRRACCRAFARAGAAVLVHYVASEAKAKRLLAELTALAPHRPHRTFRCNVTREDQVAALVEHVDR